MILVPKFSLTVVGKLAPDTQIPEHRPVRFHGSKVLLVKFITRFIGRLGLGQLEETLHQSHGLAFLILSSQCSRLLGLSPALAGVCTMPHRNLRQGLQLAIRGKERASHQRLESFNVQGSFPCSEMCLSLAFPAITVEALSPLLSALCFCGALEAFFVP